MKVSIFSILSKSEMPNIKIAERNRTKIALHTYVKYDKPTGNLVYKLLTLVSKYSSYILKAAQFPSVDLRDHVDHLYTSSKIGAWYKTLVVEVKHEFTQHINKLLRHLNAYDFYSPSVLSIHVNAIHCDLNRLHIIVDEDYDIKTEPLVINKLVLYEDQNTT